MRDNARQQKSAFRRLLQRAVAVALVMSFCTGCYLVAPGIRIGGNVQNVDKLETSGEEQDALRPVIREITPELLLRYRRERHHAIFNPGRYPPRRELKDSYGYRIGRGDVLSVVVWNHPELSNPMGTTAGAEGIGRLVRDDGSIFFPFAGEVPAEGLSPREVRREIAERIAPFVEDPQVDVRVVEFRSQKVYVTGEVSKPGFLYLDDRPITILDAISHSGGFNEVADQRFAQLTRDGEQRIIDLEWLYSTGSHDELLQDGDVVHVREDSFNQVFVMGEVTTQSMIPMRRGRLSLAEAIATAEGLSIGTANTRRIAVIRGEPQHDEDGTVRGIRPVIYQLDGSRASALVLAEGFDLEPRDIVFIPASAVVRWNRIIDQILPTIQTLWMTDRLIRG